MSGTMSTATSVALMDVRRAPYVLTLPKTTDIPYRVLTMKDVYGKASFLSTITVLTQSPDVFEDGTTSKVFTNPNEITQLLAGQPGYWYTIGGTSLNAVSYKTVSTGILNAYTISTQQLFVSSLRGDGSQLQNLAGVSTAAVFTSNTSNYFSSAIISTVAGLGSAGFISSSQLLSSLANFKSGTSTFSTITVAQAGDFSSVITGLFSGSSLTVSSINGTTVGGPLFSTVIGLGSAGYISSSQLLSSLANFQSGTSTFSTITVAQSGNFSSVITGLFSGSSLTVSSINGATVGGPLFSTVIGLGSAGYVSTANLVGLVSTPNLLNLVSTQNLLGLVSTPNLLNLVSTNNLLNLVSTQNLQNLVSTPHLYSMLQSTVAGLGSINYISSAQLLSTTSGFETYISSQIGLAGNNYYGAVLYLNYSITTSPYKTLDTTTTGASATTLTNTVAAGTSQAISQFQTDDTMTPFIPNGIWNLAVFADSTNPNTYLYMSLYARSGGVETLVATTITTPTDLYGPVAAITEYPISLAVPYTQTPPGTTVVLKIFASNADSSSATIRTYYEGNTYSFLRTTFGTIIPADSLTSTVAGLGNASYLSSTQLISTVAGLGSATYISSSQLLSTIAGLGSAGYVSTANLVGHVSTANLIGLVSTQNLLGLVSTPNLLNLVSTNNLLGLVSTPNLVNLVSTNNLLNLVSTPNLVNLVSTNNLLNLVSTQNLLGLVSTPNLVNLVSTNNLLNLVSTQNLLNLVSTPNLVNLVSTNNLLNLVSTQNLLGLVSTPNLVNLVSTNNLLNLVSTQNLLNLVSTPNLVNLVSTNNLLNLVSTQNLLNLISTQNILNLVSTTHLESRMQSTVIGLATVGYVSSTQLLSSLSNANISSMRVTGIANISTLTVSTLSSAFFYSLQGSVSSLQVNALTIGTGTGSINLGDIVTTSISSISTVTNILLASTATIYSISSLQIVASSIRADGSQLQNVAGISTIALFTSNTSNFFIPILSNNYSTNLQSTVIGLGSAGYISSSQFQSSMLGITSNISTMIDPIELASTITGLGTIGFVSSIGLTNIMNSTVIGLNDYISTMIDPIELASSIVGLGTIGFVSSIGFDSKFGSTLTSLTGSLITSTFQTIKISTSQITVSTVQFQDQLANNPMGNIYQYSSILYYNNFVIAGTSAMNIQNFTF